MPISTVNMSKKSKTKSILKPPNTPTGKERRKSTHWDEDNIRATLHPEGKDYGLMKIDEAKTPYNWSMPPSEKESPSTSLSPFDRGIDADLLEKKLQNELKSTLDKERRRKVFEEKRKAHYNEYKTLKDSRGSMSLDDEDEDEENIDKNQKEKPRSQKGSTRPSRDDTDTFATDISIDIASPNSKRVNVEVSAAMPKEATTSSKFSKVPK